ncbi:Hypothetical protein D9617_9g023900 [Elsinoe fawcettii]|nr:Hypothetical protein D9617_9g023900 [Elsinoe fawcettii]
MGLVEYSDSDEDRDDHDEPVSKRRRLSNDDGDNTNPELPPLPDAFLDLYSGAARVSQNDDPSLHGGRKRIVPHVEGNWAAHVYLEFHPSPHLSHLLARLLSLLSSPQPRTTPQSPASASQRKEIHTLLLSPTSVPLPLHISLSAPLILQTSTKDAFQASLLSSLHRLLPSLGTRTGTLSLRPTDLAWHANQEGTRSFLVLRVGKAEEDGAALGKVLAVTNAVARNFGLAELYVRRERGVEEVVAQGEARRPIGEGMMEEDKFHISIAWSLNAGEELGELSGEAKEVLEEIKKVKIQFRDVKVKVGRDVTSVPFLRSRRDGARGGMLG